MRMLGYNVGRIRSSKHIQRSCKVMVLNALQYSHLRIVNIVREAADSDYVVRAGLPLCNGESVIQSEAKTVALLEVLPGIARLCQSVGVDGEVRGSRKLGALLYIPRIDNAMTTGVD